MKEVTGFCFKDNQGKYIAITKYGATWVNNAKKCNISFDKNSLKLAISYLQDQCFFFNVSSLTFCLTMDILMWSDPTSSMNNLFLFTYESKWMLLIKKSNLQKARKFAKTFRIIPLCYKR